MTYGFSKTVEDLLDLFFPPRCLVCRGSSREKICSKCRSGFAYIESPICRICGTPLEDDTMTMCEGCLRELPFYSICRSVLHYRGELRSALILMKFQGKLSLIPILANYLSEYLEENTHLFETDVIVPVPKGSASRIGPSGSASALCTALKKRLDRPVHPILIRTRKTRPQRTLDLSERWKNTENAFAVTDTGVVSGRTVLLIDDIFTSGATVSNCSKTLTEAGADEVKVLTLARAAGPRGKILIPKLH